MSDLEFYADVLRSGAVLGLDAHSTPEQVTAVLGTDFGEYRTREAMIRDSTGRTPRAWHGRRHRRGRGCPDQPWSGLFSGVRTQLNVAE
jgi:hypothetical protein